MRRMRTWVVYGVVLFVFASSARINADPSISHVDASASGAGNGVSWCDAFNSLQDALTAAAASGGDTEEIWQAENARMRFCQKSESACVESVEIPPYFRRGSQCS